MNLDFEFNILSRKIKLDKFDISFVLLLLVLLTLQFNFLSTLKQIPSPLYGGDFYNGLGGVIHILDGGNVLASAQMAGEHPWVPWLYHLLVAFFSKLTGLDAVRALIYFSLVAQVLSSLAVYSLVSKSGNNKLAALVGVLIINSYFPVFKYSDFSSYLILPAFVLSLAYFFENQGTKRAITAGLFLALCGLSNTQAFFVSNIFLVAVLLLRLYSLGYLRMNILNDKDAILLIKNFAIVFTIGFALSLLFWFKLIFVFKGSTPNDIQNITTPDVNAPSVLWKSIFDLLSSLFLPYGTAFPLVILSFICLVGFYASIRGFRTDLLSFLAVATLLAQLISIFHPLLTLPLFNKHLVNFMMFDRLGPLCNILLLACGFAFLFSKVGGIKRNALVLALLILAAFAVISHNDSLGKDQWMNVGKEALAQPYAELSGWVRSNTGVNDVFVTTNEDGFMLNALTGRKILSYRRAHSSPYIDMNQRMFDQAVIVYGSDDTERLGLLKKYDVKYLLWTNRWLFNEFSFDDQGKLVGFFDPLNVPNNVTNRVYWDKYGVSYITAKMSLDPAPRSDAPFYDMLIAVPKQPSIAVPYSPELLNHFKLIKTINYGGQDFFRIYEFTG